MKRFVISYMIAFFIFIGISSRSLSIGAICLGAIPSAYAETQKSDQMNEQGKEDLSRSRLIAVPLSLIGMHYLYIISNKEFDDVMNDILWLFLIFGGGSAALPPVFVPVTVLSAILWIIISWVDFVSMVLMTEKQRDDYLKNHTGLVGWDYFTGRL